MREGVLKKAMVREEFYILTGDFFQALVLNQFNFYQHAARHVDVFIAQENQRAELGENTEGDPVAILATEGWFYKTFQELVEELMHPFKKSRASEIVQVLISKGWVLTRTNPFHRWDRTRQYRLDLCKIQNDLAKHKLNLPSWDIRTLHKTEADENPQGGNAFPLRGNGSPRSGKQYHREPTEGTLRESPNPLPSKGLPESTSSPGITEKPKASPERPVGDWLEQARRDPLAQLFCSTLDDTNTPVDSAPVARKYIKRRRDFLSDKGVRLLAVKFHRARFEGTEVPEWRRVKTFAELLEPKHLKPALDGCRLVATEDLDEVDRHLSSLHDPQAAVQQMFWLRGQMSALPSDAPLLPFCRNRSDILACCKVAYEQGRDLTELHAEMADGILAALQAEHHWSALVHGKFKEVFGHDEGFVTAAQDHVLNRLKKEKSELLELL